MRRSHRIQRDEGPHETVQAPTRKQPEIALVQLGAGIDIGAIPRSLVTPETVEIILAEYPCALVAVGV